MLRVLPKADRKHGEELRLSLARTVSQFYEQECGELPAIDSRSLIRALEGDRLVTEAGVRESAIDAAVLARCVKRALEEAGWTDTRELLDRARSVVETEPARVRAWVGRFDRVFVDDAHDLPDTGLEFLRRSLCGAVGSATRSTICRRGPSNQGDYWSKSHVPPQLGGYVATRGS